MNGLTDDEIDCLAPIPEIYFGRIDGEAMGILVARCYLRCGIFPEKCPDNCPGWLADNDCLSGKCFYAVLKEKPMIEDIKNTILLSLDASTVAIGWALMDYRAVIAHGVQRLKGDFYDRLLHACNWLEHQFSTHDSIGAFAIEQPVMHSSKPNVKTTLKLAYMDGALISVATRHVSNVFEIIPGERLVALGLPARTPREFAKTQVTQYANAIFNLSITEDEHDAADAIAVGLAAFRKMLKDCNIQNY